MSFFGMQTQRTEPTNFDYPYWLDSMMQDEELAYEEGLELSPTLESVWRVVDAPSLPAFQLGGRMLGSPNAWVVLFGAVLCIGAFIRGVNKLDKRLTN